MAEPKFPEFLNPEEAAKEEWDNYLKNLDKLLDSLIANGVYTAEDAQEFVGMLEADRAAGLAI